jgi:3-oxoacyl-ACP reductase-like protein
MGLVRGMARTAVVAGTATAVSNRVSRRQANKWAEQDAPQQQYAEPPPQQYAAPAPVAAAAPAAADPLEQLQKLGELKAAGVLTEEEFAAQKAKILAQ